MTLAPHSNEWYDRLAELHHGYVYPWKSLIPPNNGEDTYLEMVKEHISPEKDVIDIGCGHGEVPIMLAPYCKSMIGYDRVRKYIEIAQEQAQKEDIKNIQFLCANSKMMEMNIVRMPVDDNSINLFISRRGPTHWFPDVPRAAKSKAVLIQLNPIEGPIPAWNHELPEIFRTKLSSACPNQDFPNLIEKKLSEAGIKLHSYWIFDLPQIFESVSEYYRYLAWGYSENEIPALSDCKKMLEDIFNRYGDSQGLDLRFRRFLWKAEYIKTR